MVLLSILLVGCDSKTEKSLIQINKSQDEMINTLIANNNKMSDENKRLVENLKRIEEKIDAQNLANETRFVALDKNLGYASNTYNDWLYFNKLHQKNIACPHG